MISFSKFIAEQNSSIKAQASNSAVSQKLFPELSPKKRPKRLTLGQKIQHRRQKDRAKGASIDNKGTINLKESKAKPFTITNKFGGVKYKNIKMAHHSTPIVPSEISKPIHHNYLQKKPEFFNPTDITASTERRKKIEQGVKDLVSGKTIKKGISSAKDFGDKVSGVVKTVTKPVTAVVSGISTVAKVGNKLGKGTASLIHKGLNKMSVDEPITTSSPNPEPTKTKRTKPFTQTTKVVIPKPDKDTDPVYHDPISI